MSSCKSNAIAEEHSNKITKLESENKALKKEMNKITNDLQECKQMLQTLMNKQNAQRTEQNDINAAV